jgi:hypothetical protein
MKYIHTYESFLNESIITVVTQPYRTTHGKEPSNGGEKGLWFFKIDGEEIPTPTAMKYQDALKWAKEEAKKRKVGKIEVLG